ncbi:MAG: hypothetical protein CMQ41_01600 [Gammaproteobacteria bacterium]|nr:hypothetical protein [Gammaproteobacteria bacterium]
MSEWPKNTSFESFKARWKLDGEALWCKVFELHQDKMQIKNRDVAIHNLEKILKSTFKLTYSKGFQGMSLRDLSRETGISMGGLYSYIGSKNDLAFLIHVVQRKYIEQVIGSLEEENLAPIECLRAIIFGEIYMMEIMSPWYYFCFMELKGLPKEQQQGALDVELQFEETLMKTIRKGIDTGDCFCEHPELLATQITGQLQQWHLKKWKFKMRDITTEQYAEFVFDSILSCLRVDTSDYSNAQFRRSG